MPFQLPQDRNQKPVLAELGANVLETPQALKAPYGGIRALGAVGAELGRMAEKRDRERIKLTVQDRLNQYNRELNKVSNSIFQAKGKDASERLREGAVTSDEFRSKLSSDDLDDRTSAYVKVALDQRANAEQVKWNSHVGKELDRVTKMVELESVENQTDNVAANSGDYKSMKPAMKGLIPRLESAGARLFGRSNAAAAQSYVREGIQTAIEESIKLQLSQGNTERARELLNDYKKRLSPGTASKLHASLLNKEDGILYNSAVSDAHYIVEEAKNDAQIGLEPGQDPPPLTLSAMREKIDKQIDFMKNREVERQKAGKPRQWSLQQLNDFEKYLRSSVKTAIKDDNTDKSIKQDAIFSSVSKDIRHRMVKGKEQGIPTARMRQQFLTEVLDNKDLDQKNVKDLRGFINAVLDEDTENAAPMVSDPKTYNMLLGMYRTNPEKFARTPVDRYLPKLNKADARAIRNLQISFLKTTNTREHSREQQTYTKFKGYVNTHFKAEGFDPTIDPEIFARADRAMLENFPDYLKENPDAPPSKLARLMMRDLSDHFVDPKDKRPWYKSMFGMGDKPVTHTRVPSKEENELTHPSWWKHIVQQITNQGKEPTKERVLQFIDLAKKKYPNKDLTKPRN